MRTVLVIAGSDSGGGAGIQADLAALRDHGLHGATAITAVTAQNTRGVLRVDALAPDAVVAQIEAVFADLPVAAVKVGMLATAPIARSVHRALDRHARGVPWVVDPVMVSTSGHRLLDAAAVEAVRDLAADAGWCTPNLPEAAVLGGVSGADVEAWAVQAGRHVVVTGGDADGDEVVDRWYIGGAARRAWRHPRIPGGPFHGTGCTFASALAARLAREEEPEAAVGGAIAYVRRRLMASVAVGGGARIGGLTGIATISDPWPASKTGQGGVD
ncbi:MAG: hypothetical protein RLZZ383_116 [Pseudomonadota bacterium]|jgi:hydroxymethylpyrimidine/phosphomethylpyrimidine kinase